MDDGETGRRGWPVNIKQWTLDIPTKVMTGLWHLEGETVSILGDGSVFPPQVVTNGRITLPEYVTRCHIGLAYTARAKTLPPTSSQGVIEGKRKTVNSIAVRLDKTRGVKSGRALDELYPMRERKNEVPGLPTEMINGIEHQIISTNWDDNGQTYMVQTDPLPVTILSVIQELDIGDDSQ